MLPRTSSSAGNRLSLGKRPLSVAATCMVGILVLGYLVSVMPRGELEAPAWLDADEPPTAIAARHPGGVLRIPPPFEADPAVLPREHAREAREAEVRDRFNQGVVMMHAREYAYAVKALHRVLELAPRMPEAHVNMGFALLGEHEPAAAADFFASAIEIRPLQANAWYGMAVALDELGDRELALGAMRSFLHLAGEAEAPYLPRARAAIWEWQAALAAADARPEQDP